MAALQPTGSGPLCCFKPGTGYRPRWAHVTRLSCSLHDGMIQQRRDMTSYRPRSLIKSGMHATWPNCSL